MSVVGIVYHNDNDGKCAAAIAYRGIKEKCDSEIICIESDYDKRFPDLPDDIEKVYVLDFSFDNEGFQKLIDIVGRDKIVWIDHHISQIIKLSEFADLKGIRTEKWSGTMLTWLWFNNGKEIPYVVDLIDDYDRWKLKYGDESLYFYEYTQTVDVDNIKGEIWDKLLSMSKEELDPYIEKGSDLKELRYKKLRQMATTLGIPMTINWEGKEYSCLKINNSDHKSTSQLGEIVYKEMGYDICWDWYEKKSPDSDDLLEVNHMRSVNVDVSKIAMKFGGGGHPNASGFITKLGTCVYNMSIE